MQIQKIVISVAEYCEQVQYNEYLYSKCKCVSQKFHIVSTGGVSGVDGVSGVNK